MNTIHYPVENLVRLLHEQKVATMPQLKAALGTSVTYTVLRKLSPPGYHSSYSHGGSPQRGCAGLDAVATAKIPRRSTPCNFRTGSKAPPNPFGIGSKPAKSKGRSN